MMINLKLSARERELIHLWIDGMRESAEHYGGGSVVFPEEAMIEEKLDSAAPEPAFTSIQLELILDWAAIAISDEERMLIGRIRKALGPEA